MENNLACVKCKTLLPQDKPAEKRFVRCIFCGCPNPNPNIPEDLKFLELTDENQKPRRRRERTINLEQSSLSRLLSGGILLSGIILSIVLFLYPTNWRIYLSLSLILLIPTIRSSFVNSQWKNTLVRLSSRSQEHYDIYYEADNSLHFIVSFVYMFFFTYRIFYNTAPYIRDYQIHFLPIVVSAVTAWGLTWFIGKAISTAGEFLGRIFSKK